MIPLNPSRPSLMQKQPRDPLPDALLDSMDEAGLVRELRAQRKIRDSLYSSAKSAVKDAFIMNGGVLTFALVAIVLAAATAAPPATFAALGQAAAWLVTGIFAFTGVTVAGVRYLAKKEFEEAEDKINERLQRLERERTQPAPTLTAALKEAPSVLGSLSVRKGFGVKTVDVPAKEPYGRGVRPPDVPRTT